MHEVRLSEKYEVDQKAREEASVKAIEDARRKRRRRCSEGRVHRVMKDPFYLESFV